MSATPVPARRCVAAASLAAACVAIGACNDVYGSTPTTAAPSVPSPPTVAPPTTKQIFIEDTPFAVSGGADAEVARALLQKHAAKLTSCPPEQVRVRHTVFSQQWVSWDAFLADGCGQRVVYGEAGHVVSTDPAEPKYGGVSYYVVSHFPLGAAGP